MDCVKDKNQDLCQQEAVKAYPTFHYYHYGKLVEKYESDRTVSQVAQEQPFAEGGQEPQQSARTLPADKDMRHIFTLGVYTTANSVSLWVCPGIGGTGGYTSAQEGLSSFFSFSNAL